MLELAQVELHERSGSGCVQNDGFCPDWIAHNLDRYVDPFFQQVFLVVVSVAIGFVIATALALLAHRRRWLVGPIIGVTGVLYTIPSIALFVLMIPITGLSITSVEVGLVSYTLLILIRNIVVGLRSVPEDVREAATGMGYSRRQMLWKVELPMALPAIMAGVRVATVSTVGLVTVGFIIGKGGLGELIIDGLDRFYTPEVIVGIVLSIALALTADGLLLVAQNALTPWARSPGRRSLLRSARPGGGEK
jgi:osmoprotectant transport system permease protein